MKKRIISAVAILALLFGPMSLKTAKSQILILEDEEELVLDQEQEGGITLDRLDTLDVDIEVNIEVDEQGLELPMAPGKAGIAIDKYAPLGGEIFLLSCLGGAYLLGKRRRKE